MFYIPEYIINYYGLTEAEEVQNFVVCLYWWSAGFSFGLIFAASGEFVRHIYRAGRSAMGSIPEA